MELKPKEEHKMKEQILREAVRAALKEIAGDSKSQPKEVKERFIPEDKEHFQQNRENLNKELMRRWGIGKKK